MTQPHTSANGALQTRRALRKTLLDLRRNASASQREQWDYRIGQQLLAWCQQHRPASLGLFWPIQDEPDLRDTYPLLQQMGIQLALPLVVGKALPLVFLKWKPGDAMSADDYGIPVPARRECETQPQVLLIPCVGFTVDYFRMGYGGGYYDRTLASQPRPLALGVAYSQAQTTFEVAAHDIAMDTILTELSELNPTQNT